MNTGLKTIDNLIRSFGVRTEEGADKSQSLTTFAGGDFRVNSVKMPHCIMQKILQAPQDKQFRLLQWFLPHKQARLASFLIDESGTVVEQVYFQRDARHVEACRRIQKTVARTYRQLAVTPEVMAA